ncbi:MAG: hydroxylase [Hellea sp.]|nr:hydroxylase [Hellea sp.]
MRVRYLEIVTKDVDGTIAVVEATGLKFSEPDTMLGNARVADMSDGGQVAVRAPMHDAEDAVTRTYFSSTNIEKDTQAAITAGAELAHPIMEIPGKCHFSIFFHGENQFGFWQDQ